MKKRFLAVVALAASSLPLPVMAVDQVLVLGEGRTTCAGYVSDRQHGKWLDTIEWVEGYLTGYETAANFSFPASLVGADVIKWFDSYCPAHPNDSILHAADTFGASAISNHR